VLTAAHCVYDNNNKVVSLAEVEVVLGAQNINQTESSQQHLTVTAVIPHELYLANEQDDVALLQLATPATLNDRVQPIALFTGGTLADPGELATVTGWGVTELGGTSSLLKQVTVAIVSNKACNLVYQADNIKITDGMMCAGGQAGQDSCNGDSGGPLVVPNGSGGYLLAGLVSFGGLSSGNLCGDAGVPGVYARVSYYVNWIKANMGEVAPVPTNLIVNENYGVRADGGWAVKGSQRVTTTIQSGLVISAAGGTVSLDNYTTFTSDAQTFNGQAVSLHFTGSLTTSAPVKPLNSIGLAYNLTAVDATSQKAISVTGRYTITLSYNHLLPLASGLKESRLGLYYYNNGTWLLEPTSQVDLTAKTVSATPNHLSVWAVLADSSIRRVYVPNILNKYCANAFIYNETVLYDMKAIKADQGWADYCFPHGEGIIVAVLDTGVDLTHPDLEANLVTGRNFVEGSSFDPEDDQGHGTNVAGIIAAVANNGNAIGVAPKAKIMPVRVLGQDGGTFAGVAQGIAWAADNGANIINMSLGGTATSNVMRDAVDYAHGKGVFLVAAAGNCGDQYYVNNGCDFRDQTNYPAAYDSVMAVAATNEDNEQSTFSNQNNYVEIAAPGSNIYNAYLYGGYRSISGTSQATPHVAGLAALIWSRNRDLTNEQVRALIRNTATDLGARGRDIQYGYGLINVAAALNLDVSARAASTSENPPEPAPTEAINAPFVAGQLLIKLKPWAKLSDVLQQQALQSQGVAETIPQITVQLINVPVGEERAYLERLQQSAEVEYVELNYELGIRN
jgi:type VII secretion-associated serine protease mycosin